MRPDQITRIDAALTKGYNVLAGDEITIVGEDEQITITAIMYDFDNYEKGEVLSVGAAGIRNDGIREILILKSDLADEDFTLLPTMHMLIDGVRWDFVSGDPLMEAVVPIGGLHNMIICWVTKAVELEKTEPTAEWSWNNT